MGKRTGFRAFCLILTSLAALLFSCETNGSKSDEARASIKYTGELKTGCQILFNGSDSHMNEYYKWSYKEETQADTDYVTVDADEYYFFLYFVKAGNYNVKLEVKDGIFSILTLIIAENVIDPALIRRLRFHNNNDGTYMALISLEDAMHDLLTETVNNDLISISFGSLDNNYNSLIGYNYYQYLIRDSLLNDDLVTVVTGPCFVYSTIPNRTPFLDTITPENLPQDMPIKNVTKEELQKAYLHNLWIEVSDGDGDDPHRIIDEFRGYVALTDDSVIDFFIIKN